MENIFKAEETNVPIKKNSEARKTELKASEFSENYNILADDIILTDSAIYELETKIFNKESNIRYLNKLIDEKLSDTKEIKPKLEETMEELNNLKKEKEIFEQRKKTLIEIN